MTDDRDPKRPELVSPRPRRQVFISHSRSTEQTIFKEDFMKRISAKQRRNDELAAELQRTINATVAKMAASRK